MKFDVRYANHPADSKGYDTEKLRRHYHISNIFEPDSINLTYSHQDRIIAGGIMPVKEALVLESCKELAAPYFLARRELGAINIGGPGVIFVDGTEYKMDPKDGIYVGMGAKELVFKSLDQENPAKFYMNSCPAHPAKFYMVSAPAHCAYETRLIKMADANHRPLGSVETCNKRTINQFIHPDVLKTCQLSMGMTELEPGSNWNTMPSHTHERRMEIYTYFELPEGQVVFHMCGEPTQTRHIVMHNEDAVISPSWSIHSGVGTSNYTFIWAMGGENMEFDDMDNIATTDLR